MKRKEEIETCEDKILAGLRSRAQSSIYYDTREDRRKGLNAMFEYLGILKRYEREYDELSVVNSDKS
tara:strand:+ start:271 stop:471 length:201 start_codon:yes stop_codon:yes gene_type:complete